MPTLAQTLAMPLWAFNSDAEKFRALLDDANGVDATPTAAEVEQFLDLLAQYWSRSSMLQVRALMKVVGNATPTGYQGGFLHGAGALPWAHFSREIVALQLVVRIADYRYIEQRTHPLCGPVTFMHGVARRDVEEYVDYTIGLAANLRGTIGNLTVTVRPGSALLQKHAHASSIREADYIALASLRNSSNWFPYRAPLTNRTLEGATSPGTVVRWLRDAGYTNVEDHTHLLWRAAGALIKSHRAAFAEQRMQRNIAKMQARLAAGYTVLMAAAGNLAHTTLADGSRDAKYMTVFGGHFMLVTAVTLTNTGASFRIVSWGQEATNPVEISWSKLASWYNGFVCARP